MTKMFHVIPIPNSQAGPSDVTFFVSNPDSLALETIVKRFAVRGCELFFYDRNLLTGDETWLVICRAPEFRKWGDEVQEALQTGGFQFRAVRNFASREGQATRNGEWWIRGGGFRFGTARERGWE